MDVIFKFHYQLQLLNSLIDQEIKWGQRVDYVLFGYDENNKKQEFLEPKELIEYMTYNEIKNPFIFTKIVNLCNHILSTQKKKHDTLSLKNIEKEFRKFFDMGCSEISPECSDFVFVYARTPAVNLDPSKGGLFFKQYFQFDFCGYCEYSVDEIYKANMRDNYYKRSTCKCKLSLLQEVNFEMEYFKCLFEKCEQIKSWVLLSFPNLDYTEKEYSGLGQPDIKPYPLNKEWFKVGLKFANGEIENCLQNGIVSAPKIAKKIGCPGGEKYILASLNNYSNGENRSKNIFHKSYDKVEILRNYFADKKIEPGKFFNKKVVEGAK